MKLRIHEESIGLLRQVCARAAPRYGGGPARQKKLEDVPEGTLNVGDIATWA